MFGTKKPRIGITKPTQIRFSAPYFTIWISIWLSGGIPVVLKHMKKKPSIDGLVLGGGKDVYPALYQQKAKSGYLYDRERDYMEKNWLDYALARKLPVLGICRGAQMLNVHLGGNLHMDLSLVYSEANYPHNFFAYQFFRKKILLSQNTLMHRIFNCDEMMVNSIHKQSIDKLGKGLKVTAREPNGIIQAVEKEDHPFLMGVQFHPERLIYQRRFRKLFQVFIRAAWSMR